MKYLAHYPDTLKQQVQELIKGRRLGEALLNKYPSSHDITTDKALYSYVTEIKNRFLKKSQPLSKVVFDARLHLLSHALGTHTYAGRIQGSKIKAKNEIRIASVFKCAPEEFLRMITVHELAHFKEKEHNKAFYQLCTHMEPRYHQLEFDVRLYLTHLDLFGKLY